MTTPTPRKLTAGKLEVVLIDIAKACEKFAMFDSARILVGHLRAVEAERDRLREALRHARYRNHEHADWCAGCQAVDAELEDR